MSKLLKKRYISDSYETEIKISLILLICFLLSLNFLSAWSLGKARSAQYKGFVNKLDLALESIRFNIKSNHNQLPDMTFLNDVRDIAGVDKIEIIDSLGNQVMVVSAIDPVSAFDGVVTAAPIRDSDGHILYHISVASVNKDGQKLQRLALFDAIFRIAGLIAGLIVAYLFIRSVMNPYRKIKKEAAKLDLSHINLDDAGSIEYAVRAFQQVIRELKEKEEILQSMYDNSEKRADSLARYNEYILGGISSGVIICNTEGLVTRFNPAAKKIIAYSQEFNQDMHFNEVFGKKHQISKILSEALYRDITYSRTEFDILNQAGERQWIGLSSSLIFDNHQKKIGAAVLLTDLTKIKRLQEISDFTEKMAALGEMSAGLAHEFRNSMAAIMGFGSLLKKMIPSDDKTFSIAEMIIKESQTTEEMLRRFLTFAKPLTVVAEPIFIKRIIEDCLRTAKDIFRDSNIKTIIEDDSNNMRINADPTLLKNAFSNIINNAYQAMESGGILTVIIEPHNNDRLEIKISDTGKGISADDLPKIFNPFFTTRENGTGLGLALVRKMITGHMGTIDVESRVNIGTNFIISLPTKININEEKAEPVINRGDRVPQP